MLAYAVFSILSDQQQQQKYILLLLLMFFFATFFRSLTFFPHNNIVGKNSVFGTQLHTYMLFHIMLLGRVEFGNALILRYVGIISSP